MGRQARGTLLLDSGRLPIELHLEATVLELRGGLRRDLDRATLTAVSAADGVLSFVAGADRFAVELGPAAGPWAKALLTPAPSLAHKLGLRHGIVVLLEGEPPAPVREALDEVDAGTATAASLGPAELVIATVRSAEQLAALPAWLAGSAPGAAVWVVHGKGASPMPGGTGVRETLRAAGLRDTKVSAVSDEWSATRYTP